MNPRVLSEAFDDLQEAIEWYDLHAGAVSDRLEHEFFSAVSKIAALPLTYPPIYREFRRVLLKPFPYLLYYRPDGDEVVVTLLFHASRNPRIARQLLNQRRYF